MNQTEPLISGKTPIIFDALNYNGLITIVIVLIGYLLLLRTSGRVVRYSFRHAGVNRDEHTGDENEEDTGRAIGKLENLLVLTLMLLQAYTALGVIFAAKSIVRKDDMGGGDTSYYLTGTIANFTYSVIVGVLLSISLWTTVTYDLAGRIVTFVC